MKRLPFILLNMLMVLAVVANDIFHILTYYSKDVFESRYSHLKKHLFDIRSERKVLGSQKLKYNFMRQYVFLCNAIISFNKMFGCTLSLLVAHVVTLLIIQTSDFMALSLNKLTVQQYVHHLIIVLVRNLKML